MNELPPLLSASDLGQLMKMSAHGIRAMIRRGELPASRLGRRWFVRRDALEALLKRREMKAAPLDGAARALRGLSTRPSA